MNATILCFVDYYLPGYKGGGPIRTIVNLVENLGDKLDFLIFTRDRDLKAKQPYEGVMINEWNIIGKAKVFYASPERLNFHVMKSLLMNTDYDMIYLNSFFSPRMTILPLFIRWIIRESSARPAIVAPRGEFSPGALTLKSKRKKIYISLARVLGLYRNVIWHASTDREAQDILRNIGNHAKVIRVAPNIPSNIRAGATVISSGNGTQLENYCGRSGLLRMVFLSRISPMKNLDYLLRALNKVNASVELRVFGPIEDDAYWGLCLNLIDALPKNILVQYEGNIAPEQVPRVFAEHDVFVLPTKGENYGHVILESLSSGTPVIISDQTPWKNDEKGAIEVLPLANIDRWVLAIIQWSQLSDKEKDTRRKIALECANSYIQGCNALQMNLELFSICHKEYVQKY